MNRRPMVVSVEHEDRRPGHQQQHPDRYRHVEKAPDEKINHHHRRLDRGAGRDEVGEPEQNGVNADRGHQRRHFQERHDQPSNGADTAAHGKRGGDVEQHHAGIGTAVRQLGDDHRGKRHDAGGRKIEAALLDHQMLADRGHGEDGEIRQRREDRGGIHRARRRDAADQHQKHGRDEGLSGEWKLGQVLAEAGCLQERPDRRRKRRKALAELRSHPLQKLGRIFAQAGHSQTQCLLVRHIPHPRPTPPPLIPAHAGIQPDRRTKLGPHWVRP